MSTKANTLIQNLNLYGNSGSDSVLLEVSIAVDNGGTFGTVALPLALKVSKRIFRILDEGTKPSMIAHALNCLLAMCQEDTNREAKRFVQTLEDTTILRHCTRGCRDLALRMLCTHILLMYAFNSDKHCCEMLQHAGLLEAVLMVIDVFQPNGGLQACMAAHLAVRMLKRLFLCTHPLGRIVRAGGRHTLDTLLHKVAAVSKVTMSNPCQVLTKIIDSCAITSTACCSVLSTRQNELIEGGLSFTDVYYNTEQAVHIMESWYAVYVYLWTTPSSDHEAIFSHIAHVLWFCASSYPQTDHTHADSNGIVAGEFEAMLCNVFTLKASSVDDPTKDCTFVEFLLKLAVQLECESHSSYIFQLAYKYPALKAVVEECVGKYNYCAHPDCIVSSFVHGALKNCARCRSPSVWYCSKEHQIAHWPEHKLVCERHNTVT